MEPSIFLAIAGGNVDLAWVLYIAIHALLLVCFTPLIMYFTYKIDKDAIDNWPNR